MTAYGDLIDRYPVAPAGDPKPVMRVRLQHSHTIKEGWRLSESTVEWTGPGEPDWVAIREALDRAAIVGHDEARNRNGGAACGS